MKAVLIAAVISLVAALFGTPMFIKFLVRRGYGQFIRDDGPTSHHTKRGTPTMGGAVIIAASLLAYGIAHLVTMTPVTVSGLLVLFLMGGLGLVGFLDDYIKISKQRSLGLRSGEKLAGQTLVAVLFAVLALQFPNDKSRTPASTHISFVRDSNIDLAFAGAIIGLILFVIWANLMIAGTSNGVNLTDGLDGLATGASVMVFARVRADRHLAVQPELPDQPRHQVLRGARPARPRRRGRVPDGRLLRLPVVERLAGQDLHGRHRLARPRRRARRAGHHDPHRAARRHPRRPLRRSSRSRSSSRSARSS